MSLKNFVEGVETLKPYYDNPDGYHLGAYHDAIYLYATDKPLPAEGVAKMIELGFFQEGGAGTEDDAEYDAEASWCFYV